jgi:hypothetical protein
MWIFEQSSGRLYQDTDPETVFLSYAGHADGKNNPDLQHVANVGPIPIGFYEVGPPYESPNNGPYVLRLTPAPENEMHGRAGFLIHGDSRAKLGSASHGCVVTSRPARQSVWLSGERQLKVIRGA